MSDKTTSRLRQLVAQRAAEAPSRTERYADDSKARLQTIVERKLKTSFIGAISAFEECFGELWGHGKAEAELNPVEQEFRKIWENCRNQVLTNGNNQARAVKMELKEYTVRWDRHQKQLSVQPIPEPPGGLQK